MKLEVSHRTAYVYRSTVGQSHHLVHLRPRQLPYQAVIHHSLLIEPAPVYTADVVDYFGNAGLLLRIESEHTEFIVHARSTVEVTQAQHGKLDKSAAWNGIREIGRAAHNPDSLDALQFVCPSRHVPVTPAIQQFARASFRENRPVLTAALDLTQRIFHDFTFDSRATDLSTPVTRVLETRRGVCQDFAHLAIAACRSVGVPARYVSGYLMTRPPPGQVKLKGADASHAWLSVWCPDMGWLDFDPTNGIVPTGEHITLAYGRDYEDISPISGVLLGGGDQTMTVAVDVEPVA